MKNFFSIFTSLTLSVGVVAPLINQEVYSTEFTDYQKQELELLAPTSMLNLQEDINRYTEYIEYNDSKDWCSNVEEDAQDRYNEFISKNNLASLSVVDMIPIEEVIRQTFTDVYTNTTPNKQTFQTQSYSKTVTSTSTFSIKLQESFKINAKVNFIFSKNKIEASISSDQTWTDTVSTAETLTAPSQPFTVDPFSVGKATYVIRDGYYQSHGVLRFFLPLDTKFWTSKWVREDGMIISASYNFDVVIKILKDAGYGDLLKLNSKEFSIISTDNPDKPTVSSINIPIAWRSNGGKLDVTFTQESLNF